ncbi:hypothetical protein B0H12DRAFT_1079580 [Mycena haematopus]|nr:hypothetical protein B0H12DRAFT_1079580 [Mycena haematopus]
MFVPDLLHEVELGGWKSLFAHLVRILYAYSADAVGKLDERFRKMPTFGRSTIRRFHANVSEMKKMAARDFEDILQCAFAAFEGLLPEPHNTVVLTLIYVFATWHAYAKLQMHSDSSISSFRGVTTELGSQARHFLKTTCNAYTTYELPQEFNRRARRQAKKDSQSKSKPAVKLVKDRKAWNVCTYKWHSLGDYPDAIASIGTTDSYTTQTSELWHGLSKKLYAKTNKRKFERQIANQERRRRLVRGIKRRMEEEAANTANSSTPDAGGNDSVNPPKAPKPTSRKRSLIPDDEVLPRTPPRDHHHISESKRTGFLTDDLPEDFPNDPALTNFLPNLKAHLLGRLLGIPWDGDEIKFSTQDLADVNIVGERLYTHKVLHVNYTTYDLHRDQDTLNPSTHPDFMALAHEEEGEATAHPYWYGRIISIFHADVRHVGSRSQNRSKIHRMEFVWVRWLGRDMTHSGLGGWRFKRLHRVGFVDSDHAFGFLDPAEIIRACHLTPAFHYGRTSALLGPSIAHHYHGEDNEDYMYYYVNCFVDRDMFMRYSNDAVGHRTRKTEPTILDTTIPHDDEMDVDDPPAAPASLVDEDPGPDGEVDEPNVDPDAEWSDEDESDEEKEENEEEGDDDGEKQFVGATDEEILDAAGYDEL